MLGYDEPLVWSFDTEKGLKIQVPESIPGEMAWTFKNLRKRKLIITSTPFTF